VGVEGFAGALVAEGVTARARDPWEVEVEEDNNVIDAKALVTSREIARQKADVSNARVMVTWPASVRLLYTSDRTAEVSSVTNAEK